MKLFYLFFVLILFSFSSIAQESEFPIRLEDYSEADVVKHCWENNKYTKADEKYKEEWNSQSAIFLRYEKKYELRYIKEVAYLSSAKLHVSYIAHYRIKILDQAAVDNFSEVYYVKGAHGGYNLYEGSRDKEFMNIKIIKPDGKEIIVKKKDIIEDDKGQRKVAIPNLEVGDILDYSLYTHDLSTSFYYAIIDQFTLNKNYPVKKFNYSIVTDAHWDVQFTSGEHKVRLKEKRIDKKIYEFKIEANNVDKINSTRWNYYYRTGPYIRMYVAISKGNLNKRDKDHEQLHTSSLTTEDIVSKYRKYYQKSNSAANEYGAFKGYLRRKYGKDEVSTKKNLEELYYYMRHHFTNMHYVYDRYNGSGPDSYRKLSDLEFTGHIIYALRKMKIEYDIIVVVTRQSGRIQDVINENQTDYLIRATVGKEYIYFYQPNPYTRFNKFPHEIENSKGYIVEAENSSGSKLTAKTAFLPPSEYKDNISKYETKVSFDKEDMKLLKAATKATHSGHQIEYYQYDVVDWMTMIWDENKLYKTKLWGHPSRDKSGKLANFAQAQEDNRKEEFEYLASNHFDIGDNTKLLDFKTLTTANSIDQTTLEFTFDCELSDLVKKVGPNYVLKAGALVGGQLILKEEEMKRTVDVHMTFPRGFEYTIDVEIPEGYQLKGLNNFENDIDNDAGKLKTSAVLNGNILTISFSKYYKHNYEPAKNWNLMKEFLIPGGDFLTKEILLKKKK
jgi:hypothetical protein